MYGSQSHKVRGAGSRMDRPLVVDGVPGPSAALFAVQEPRLSHDLEVVADGGLSQLQAVGEVANASLAPRGLLQ